MAITMQFPPEMFRLVRMSELGRQHFDYHPIWSEYYDFEERSEIASWGVDPVWLNQQLDASDNFNEHWAYPILRPYPLPQRMRLYIKSKFITAGGATLEGFIMNSDAYCITILVPGGEFIFSRHPSLRHDNAQELIAIRHALNNLDDAIFPIRYQTEFLDSDNRLIAGAFS